MNDFAVDIIESFTQWEELSQRWNELLSKSNADTIFLTWEWLFSWAESYLDEKRTLCILTVSKDDEIVGIAPWYIQHLNIGPLTVKQIQFLGTPEAGSDYLDVIIKKGQEKAVTHCLYEFLLKDASRRWDCCTLQDIPSNSLFLLHFLSKMEDDGKYAEISRGSFCPAVILPKKGEDLFSNYSSHRRLQYRRHLKILKSKGDLNYSSYNGENLGQALEDFCAFYEAKNEKHDKTVRPFLSRYAARSRTGNILHADLLTSNGTLIAGLLNMKYGDTLSQYLMAVDKGHNPQISVGNILVGMCLSKTIDDGYRVYDFLKGPEPYKFHWAEGGRSSINLFFYKRNIGSAYLAVVKFLKYMAKIILR